MIRNIVGLLALVVATVGQVNAGNLYNQAWDMTGTVVASQNNTAAGATYTSAAFDNFTLGATSTIASVNWVGGYFNPPVPGALTSFTVSIYASVPTVDAAGFGIFPGPGQYPAVVPLSTTTVAYGSSNETFLSAQPSPPTSGTLDFYSYAANITPFTATAGTTYWISIVANMPYPPQWGLGTSFQGDNLFWQYYQDASTAPGMYVYNPSTGYLANPAQYDLAFGLSSTPVGAVPEPATITMACMGLAGFAGMIFVRRRKAVATV